MTAKLCPRKVSCPKRIFIPELHLTACISQLLMAGLLAHKLSVNLKGDGARMQQY